MHRRAQGGPGIRVHRGNPGARRRFREGAARSRARSAACFGPAAAPAPRRPPRSPPSPGPAPRAATRRPGSATHRVTGHGPHPAPDHPGRSRPRQPHRSRAALDGSRPVWPHIPARVAPVPPEHPPTHQPGAGVPGRLRGAGRTRQHH
ncbi:basic proline-rich protein-like [Serinus canaria]|uniref:basic proline-rich protein-like n=1 Tax=Serinus canaria TaxID=9135 RepID=UPI0021CC5609|nr:basic proline-rich protein-like [Serinus canaria]